MTAREKMLVRVAVPLMAAGVLFSIGKFGVWDPIQRVRADYEGLQKTRDRKQQELQTAEANLRRYRTLYDWIPATAVEERLRQTDDERTKRYLKQVIDQIEKASGLAVTNYTPHKNRVIGSRRNKLELVNVTVKGSGTFGNVMQFLLEIYKTPDLIDVSSVKVDPDSRNREVVSATIKLEAPVIPRHRKLFKYAESLEPDPAVETAVEPQTRLEDTVVAYNDLLEWKPFDRYEKPPPPPEEACCLGEECQMLSREECLDAGGEPKGGRCRFNTCREPEPEPVVDTGDPDRDAKVVRAFMGNTILVAKTVARGRSVVDEDREFIRVGEEFDGGTLVMVHRLGAVVSKTSEEDENQQQTWLYQLGEALSASRLLNDVAEEHSEFRQIQYAMKNAEQAEPQEPEPSEDDDDKQEPDDESDDS